MKFSNISNKKTGLANVAKKTAQKLCSASNAAPKPIFVGLRRQRLFANSSILLKRKFSFALVRPSENAPLMDWAAVDALVVCIAE